MPLSTTSSSASESSGVNGLDVRTLGCAVVCAASAGVHGALVVPHAAESTRMALAFAVATVALGCAALGLATAPGATTSAAAAAVLLAVATAYVLSRTSGIPGLTEHPEPVDPLGTVISLAEVAAALATAPHPNPRRHR